MRRALRRPVGDVLMNRCHANDSISSHAHLPHRQPQGDHMLTRPADLLRKIVLGAALPALLLPHSGAQAPADYPPTLESLNQHPLPQWYGDAKLGIFIHWGLYSVPGWAPLQHPSHDFGNPDYLKYNPYAEWYLNTMRIPGSPTEA